MQDCSYSTGATSRIGCLSNSLRVSRTTATRINPPPSRTIHASFSPNNQAASRTVTTGSNVESMAELVGQIRSRPARKVTAGITVATITMPAMCIQPRLVDGKWAPLIDINNPYTNPAEAKITTEDCTGETCFITFVPTMM